MNIFILAGHLHKFIEIHGKHFHISLHAASLQRFFEINTLACEPKRLRKLPSYLKVWKDACNLWPIFKPSKSSSNKCKSFSFLFFSLSPPSPLHNKQHIMIFWYLVDQAGFCQQLRGACGAAKLNTEGLLKSPLPKHTANPPCNGRTVTLVYIRARQFKNREEDKGQIYRGIWGLIIITEQRRAAELTKCLGVCRSRRHDETQKQEKRT